MPTQQEIEIGSLISFKLGITGADVQSAAEISYAILRFPSSDAAAQYIQELLEGNLRENEGFYSDKLERLSRFLCLIGVPKNDGLIKLIEEWDGSFSYPPYGDQKFYNLIGSVLEYSQFLSKRNPNLEGTVDDRVRGCVAQMKDAKRAFLKKPVYLYVSPLDAYNACLEILQKHFPEVKD